MDVSGGNSNCPDTPGIACYWVKPMGAVKVLSSYIELISLDRLWMICVRTCNRRATE